MHIDAMERPTLRTAAREFSLVTHRLGLAATALALAATIVIAFVAPI